MDARLLQHYDTELTYLREMGAEFAREFPSTASRLLLDGVNVPDPYVERLLEGCAFLAARVQLKLNEEFPRFTQRLAQIVLPQIVCPTPAMLVACFTPDLANPNLVPGFTVPRGTALFATRGYADTQRCQFTTRADLTLWPIELSAVTLLPQSPDLPLASLAGTRALTGRIKGALRLSLAMPEGIDFAALPMDSLPLYFAGADPIAYRLFELVAAHTVAIVISSTAGATQQIRTLPGTAISCKGLEDDEAMLPVTRNMFRGYRLLHEFFAFPQRFRFAQISGLGEVLPAFATSRIELTILLDTPEPSLERLVNREHVRLYCVPAVNLFAKAADRAAVSGTATEFHVVPDRTKPLDFEVYQVNQVTGYGPGNDSERTFYPFYADFLADRPEQSAYFIVRREPRAVPDKRQRSGDRLAYVGSEVFVSIVDPREAPFGGALRQLAFDTLCTNRDLPLMMPPGGVSQDDLTPDIAAPARHVSIICGPSRPRAPSLERGDNWRLIDQLALHYLSLAERNPDEGAAALRSLLSLHAAAHDDTARRQIAGVRSVVARPIVRRLAMTGPIAYGRGLEIEVTFDDTAFHGGSAFLLGQVLDRFFARYVSINSFVQTVLRRPGAVDDLHLPARCGTRPIF